MCHVDCESRGHILSTPVSTLSRGLTQGRARDANSLLCAMSKRPEQDSHKIDASLPKETTHLPVCSKGRVRSLFLARLLTVIFPIGRTAPTAPGSCPRFLLPQRWVGAHRSSRCPSPQGWVDRRLAAPWPSHDTLAPEALECHRKPDSPGFCTSQAWMGKTSHSASKPSSRLGGSPPGLGAHRTPLPGGFPSDGRRLARRATLSP